MYSTSYAGGIGLILHTVTKASSATDASYPPQTLLKITGATFGFVWLHYFNLQFTLLRPISKFD